MDWAYIRNIYQNILENVEKKKNRLKEGKDMAWKDRRRSAFRGKKIFSA